MCCKRKLDSDDDVLAPTTSKQLKLIPFPSLDFDNDVAMTDASSPTSSFDDLFMERPRVSHLSTSSFASSAPSSPGIYPSLEVYPITDNTSKSGACGVLGSTFQHLAPGCTQIPKLRMACAAGSTNDRTMWSYCEQCGAIAMVDLS